MAVITSCIASFSRVYDMEPSETAPVSPKIGQTWTDTSVTPPVVRQWDGSAWIVLNNTNVDLDEIRGTVQNNYTHATEYADRIILNALTEYVKTGDLEELRKTFSTSFEQTSRDFTFNFTELTKRVTEVEGEALEQYNEIKQYIRFVSGGVVIGEEGNPIILTLKKDIVAFTQSGVEVAYFSNSKMFVTDLEATNSLTVGRLKFTPRDNGSIDINLV